MFFLLFNDQTIAFLITYLLNFQSSTYPCSTTLLTCPNQSMKLVLPARNLGSFRYLLGCICNTGVDGNKLSTTIFDKEGVTFTSFAHRQIFKRKSLSNPFEWENLCHQHELHSNQMHAQVVIKTCSILFYCACN